MNALRGAVRLGFDAYAGVTAIVEGMHLNIARAPLPLGRVAEGHTRGITGLVYRAVREIGGGIGQGLDALLALLPDHELPLDEVRRDAWLAALNGVVGDHLARTQNPLSLRMQLRQHGQTLPLERTALAAALPQATPRLLIRLHGLCMNDRQWRHHGHDHADALIAQGWTVVDLHYNSGRHIYENGREAAALIEALCQQWPQPLRELALMGHSMGGLVARSALHHAQHAPLQWPARLHALVFLGTPHHGAPLERGGNRLQSLVGISPYTAPLARLGMLRSAGVTDLRHGYLCETDLGTDDRFALHADTRMPLPLPTGVRSYCVAATLGAAPGDTRDRLLGDGLVPLASALGQHSQAERCLLFAPAQQRIYPQTNHWDLLGRSDIGQQLADWLQ